MTEHWDVVVLGGGPGGYSAAIRLGRAGLKTMIVDKGGLGGVCITQGCIPSKSLLHATKHLDIRPEFNNVDDPLLKKLKKDTYGAVGRLMKGIEFLLKKAHVTYIKGWGEVVDGKGMRIHQDGQTIDIKWDRLVLATGSVPADPFNLPEHERIWGSKEALKPDFVPEDVVIAGAGYVGVELATLYSNLGAKVTLIEMMPQILPGMSEGIAQVIAGALKRRGVKVLVNTKIIDIKVDKKVKILVEQRNKEPYTIDSQIMINAVGRRPNLKGWGLEVLKLQMDTRGFIFVDDTMRTSNPDVYAIGDITGPPMLAHKAYAQAKVAAANIAGKREVIKARVIPSVVYSDPPAAMVGQPCDDCISGRFPLSALGRAVAEGMSAGYVKVWADKDENRLVGCEVVGEGAETIVAEAALAIQNSLTLQDITSTVHAHPTYSEAFFEACEVALGECVHIP